MITGARTKLADDLRAVIDWVQDGPPTRLTPPAAFLVPAPNYVSAGQTFGEYVVSIDVCLVIRNRHLSEIEELVQLVLKNTVDWALVNVDSPDTLTVNGIDYYGTVVHLAKAVRP